MSEQPTEFDTIAVVGILQELDRLLVIERSTEVIAPGKICFPGGSVEKGESLTEALAREFMEEVNLDVKPIREIWTSVTSWRCKVHWWTVSCSKSNSLKPNLTEVAAVQWQTIEQLLDNKELLESNRYFLNLVSSGEINL